MPSHGKRPDLYGSINVITLEIVLIIIMLILVLGVIAFPYYISPLTSSGASGSILYLFLNLIIGFFLLAAAYFYEEKDPEYGGFALVLGIVILIVLILSLYGVTYIKALLSS